MARDVDRRRQFTRRALILGAGEAVLLSVLAGRLYYLQVIQAERYLTLAEDNRISLRLLPPWRGRILDRLGRPLAVDRPDFRVVLVAERAADVDGTLDALTTLMALVDSDRKRVMRDFARQRPFMPVAVRDDVNWEDVARVEVNALDLPGVAIQERQS